MNREEGHIGTLEAGVLIYAVLLAELFVQFPTYVIEASGPAAWQAALVMTASGLLFFLPTAALAHRFPGRGLAEISEQVAGPVVGTLLSVGVLLWLMATLSQGVRNFTETFLIATLPNTPPSIMIMVVLLAAGFASYRGVEPIARATLVLLPFLAAGALLVLLFSLPRSEPGWLFPFWGYGVLPTARGGVTLAGLFGDGILLLVLGYSLRNGSAAARSGLMAIGLFGLTLTATVLVLVLTFGAPDAAQQPFPMFNLARLVYLGRFLQRTEAIMVLFWVFASAVRTTAFLHATVQLLAGVLKLPHYRPVVFPVAVIAFALAFVSPDTLEVMRLLRDWIHPLGLAVLAVPLLLLLIAVLRKKGGDVHAA